MTKRKPGRPKVTAAERALQRVEARRIVKEEMAATTSRMEAVKRTAARLGVSERTVMDRLANPPMRKIPPHQYPAWGTCDWMSIEDAKKIRARAEVALEALDLFESK